MAKWGFLGNKKAELLGRGVGGSGESVAWGEAFKNSRPRVDWETERRVMITWLLGLPEKDG